MVITSTTHTPPCAPSAYPPCRRDEYPPPAAPPPCNRQRLGRRQRAAWVTRKPRVSSVLRPPAARVVASRAMDALCRLLEGGSAALKALSHHPYRPRGR